MRNYLVSLCLILAVAKPTYAAPQQPAALYPVPFSSHSNYMSLAGYLRLQKFSSTGVWEKAIYDYAPMQLELGDFGGDPSIGRLQAYFTFQEALFKYPHKVVFVIHWTCQAPEPGEGPMRDWHFDIRANRFRDAWPDGKLRPSDTIEIKYKDEQYNQKYEGAR